MSRPIEYDRNDVLSRATLLFWQHGYSQTSVRELLNVTGFNRHSLYENFGGKKGLFIEVLSHYKKNYMNKIIAKLNDEQSGIQTLRDLFVWQSELSAQQNGCLVSNTSNEKHEIDSELHNIATQCLEELELAIQNCIRHAKASGEARSDLDENLHARCMLTLLHGFGPLSKSVNCAKDILKVGELYIRSLQSRESAPVHCAA